jgi:hypothetical protein
VILSNQRRLSKKIGIDKFDEFPLLVLLLDDDPFASISTADLAAMEANDAEGGSGSEYEEEDEGDGDDDDEDYDE